MTIYFPEIYPDELVYSWLARYYIKTKLYTLLFCSRRTVSEQECKT